MALDDHIPYKWVLPRTEYSATSVIQIPSSKYPDHSLRPEEQTDPGATYEL